MNPNITTCNQGDNCENDKTHIQDRSGLDSEKEHSLSASKLNESIIRKNGRIEKNDGMKKIGTEEALGHTNTEAPNNDKQCLINPEKSQRKTLEQEKIERRRFLNKLTWKRKHLRQKQMLLDLQTSKACLGQKNYQLRQDNKKMKSLMNLLRDKSKRQYLLAQVELHIRGDMFNQDLRMQQICAPNRSIMNVGLLAKQAMCAMGKRNIAHEHLYLEQLQHQMRNNLICNSAIPNLVSIKSHLVSDKLLSQSYLFPADFDAQSSKTMQGLVSSSGVTNHLKRQLASFEGLNGKRIHQYLKNVDNSLPALSSRAETSVGLAHDIWDSQMLTGMSLQQQYNALAQTKLQGHSCNAGGISHIGANISKTNLHQERAREILMTNMLHISSSGNPLAQFFRSSKNSI